MKIFTSVFLLVLALGFSLNSSAETVTITAANTQFSPNNVTIELGDVIEWEWVSGSHTTTSFSVPLGAAMWDEPLNNMNQSFSYTPTLVGTYAYMCIPHAKMGMVGAFTVTDSGTNVSTVEANISLSITNTANDQVAIDYSVANTALVTFTMLDLTGKVVEQLVADSPRGDSRIYISTAALRNGIYFVQMNDGSNEMILTRKIYIN